MKCRSAAGVNWLRSRSHSLRIGLTLLPNRKRAKKRWKWTLKRLLPKKHLLRKLPLAIRNEIAKVEEKNTFKEVGAAFSQLLTRYRYWKILVKKTPGLKPYGLRHGWAWRAHKNSEKQLHYSQASALLGHTTRVHLDYYSSWVSEDELEKAVEEYNKNIKSVAL